MKGGECYGVGGDSLTFSDFYSAPLCCWVNGYGHIRQKTENKKPFFAC